MYYSTNFLYYSPRRSMAFSIVSISETVVTVRPMIPGPNKDVNVQRNEFDAAIENGNIDFSMYAKQNAVIDGFNKVSTNKLRGGVAVVTRWPHKPKTAGSSPAPATKQ